MSPSGFDLIYRRVRLEIIRKDNRRVASNIFVTGVTRGNSIAINRFEVLSESD
jgi:hypothetical protein